MSQSVETTRDLIEQLYQALPSRDADRFVARLAPDAVFEMPFVIPGEPDRLQGTRQIRDYLASRWSGMSGVEVHGIYPTIYETTDPEVFVVESEVELTRPGQERGRFRAAINVIRVQDGLVTLFRDYMDTGRIIRLREAAGLDA